MGLQIGMFECICNLQGAVNIAQGNVSMLQSS